MQALHHKACDEKVRSWGCVVFSSIIPILPHYTTYGLHSLFHYPFVPGLREFGVWGCESRACRVYFEARNFRMQGAV